MSRRRIFAALRPAVLRRLSPRSLWAGLARHLRLAFECAIAVGVTAVFAWSPAPQPASTAYAAAPPAPALPAPIATAQIATAQIATAQIATAPAILSRPGPPADAALLAAVLAPAFARREETRASVRRGDTLDDVLSRAGVDRAEAQRAFDALGEVFDPRTLRAGQELTLYLERGDGTGDAQLLGLSFNPDVARAIQVARRADDSYRARELVVPLTRRVARARGAITESLYADAKREGVDDLVIAEIAQLFAFTVDFQREIHPGDTFDIVFEQFLDPAGEVVKTGDIYYVGFTPSGRDLAYWRYTPPGEDEETGYYDAAGESARRFLMKTPVNATRISSGFSRARRHPILGYTRAHKGTDFAAPRGTPIYAAGNGVVERANRFGSFGNYVRIRHANGYQTIYGHLNGFARGVRAGVHVAQGQVIGYVGMTGTATGPHLHYEVHLNGEAINPMTIDAPTGRTLNEDELPGFEVERLLIDAMGARAAPADARPDALIAADDAVDHAALAPAAPTDG